MSTANYGRTTPLQELMLGLGGEITECSIGQPSIEQRITRMKTSRVSLQNKTGRDIAFDLEAWHNYLTTSQEYAEEYTFKYAWKPVRKKILELINDPDRLRLVRMLEGNVEGNVEQ